VFSQPESEKGVLRQFPAALHDGNSLKMAQVASIYTGATNHREERHMFRQTFSSSVFPKQRRQKQANKPNNELRSELSVSLV